jgi:rod shape-determining protein MreC
MESFITRYRNFTILVAVLFAQVVGLAVQVKRSSENESSRLIRVWAVSSITPFEKAMVWLRGGPGGWWRDYIYLRGVRQENRELKRELEELRLQQVRLTEDAQQARRLQALLGFKEQFLSKTVAAQVIGSSGSEQSRVVYIDKGDRDGIRNDMAVITAEGVVGKVLRADASVSQVLLINDQTSGVGAVLEKSRLQGVLRGTRAGDVMLEKIMADEELTPGEIVLTSGGDQVFPKGLRAGTITKVARTAESFLTVRVKPAANLSKLEEVLVITQKEERVPSVAQTGLRAADILAQRLPSVPEKPAPEASKTGAQRSSQPGAGATPETTQPQAASPESAKPRSPETTDNPEQSTGQAAVVRPKSPRLGSVREDKPR